MDEAIEGIIREDHGVGRCSWYGGLADYRRYHDEEWGRPVADDRRLFEKICLEGFQSGLSWLTILRKRENFRSAFAGFDFHRVAAFDETDVERLVLDAGIIRHRGKIVSTINNARRAVELVAERGSLAAYFWSFEPDEAERPARMDLATLRVNPTSPTSVRLSKDLKKRGWTFVGPTTIYAFMQAMGLVNDHLDGCHCRPVIEDLRRDFKRP
ncbi:DNA-3-methyladenine glycosylase I [Gellertiella hungarica]|uniref:DNA-3-methyladenine glycosylase I n=1 Tax=Gellertiella hungarica TaxID=1572859 RepID=A0A7W6NKD6_9HYPH|nr:DNA-3-methyladenine glycosylase I [Gellertiella hungarica]MBB4064285.1 DNA-3-methyladenine glycosylase I [Gellertiella hungarica]